MNKDFHYNQHPGLIRTIEFVNQIRPEIVLLGERGAELEDVWARLAEIIRNACRHKRVHATDIGTKVIFGSNNNQVIGCRRDDADDLKHKASK